jgi:hypothetical protein
MVKEGVGTKKEGEIVAHVLAMGLNKYNWVTTLIPE